jgi:putative ATP-binding cassette transporter
VQLLRAEEGVLRSELRSERAAHAHTFASRELPPAVLAKGPPPEVPVAQMGGQPFMLTVLESVEKAMTGNHQPGGKTDEPEQWYMKLDFLAQCLLVVLVINVVFVIIFEISVTRCVEAREAGEEPTAEAQGQSKELLRILDGIPGLLTPYFLAGTKGLLYVTLTLSLGIIALFLAFVHNSWQLEFWNTFQSRNGDNFVNLMQIFAILIVCFVLCDVYSQYIRQLLYIDWRRYMTEHFVEKWLQRNAYYGIQLAGSVDNADQRIQEDLHLFIESAITVVWEFFNSIGHLILFVPLLLLYSPSRAFGVFYCPGWLLYLVMLWSLIGTLVTHCIGRKLIAIGFAKQRSEADFRFALVEVRDHAEAVALAGAEDASSKRLLGRFAKFRGVWWHYMQAQKRLSYFIRSFMLIRFLIPFFILGPSYFNGDVSLGRLFQLVHALGEVGSAFDLLVTMYSPLADWRATSDRLLAFQKAMAAATGGPELKKEKADDVVKAEVTVTVPGDKPLWSANLTLPPGWVFITGPEGLGKTCLLRSLAGVWPHAKGTVHTPEDSVFVSQRPFFPPCTLAEALSYPAGPKYQEGADAERRKALADVGLGEIDIKDHHAETQDWIKTLSMGQQQRLVLAQILLRSTPPKALFLDEALSHCSETGAQEMLVLLKKRLPGIRLVHVSHDLGLAKHHDVVLTARVTKGELHLDKSK